MRNRSSLRLHRDRDGRQDRACSHDRQGAAESAIRVAVVARAPLIAESIALAFSSVAEAIAVTVTTETALADEVGAHSPDVVVIDASTPACAELVRVLRHRVPDVRIAVVGVPASAAALDFAESGADGLIAIGASAAAAVDGVIRIGNGDTEVSRELGPLLLHGLSSQRATQRSPLDRLTIRERQIVELIDEGLSNKQIAVQLTVEIATVKTHVHSILKKLEVSSRGEASAVFRSLSRR